MEGEPPFVWAGIKYFCPGVERAGVRVMHDVPFLLETQSADLGDRVEDPAPVNDPPVKCVGNSRMAKL